MRKLIVCAVLLISGCGFSEKVDVMFECTSPSGINIATLFRISTGERPGDQEMKINVRPSTSTFDDSMASFSFRHGYDAIIHWPSDHDLRVDYPVDSEVTHQEMVIFGTSQTFNPTDQIKVEYREKPSTHGYFVVAKRCFNGVSK
ncbi:MAG: hypothetical protein Q9M08_00145 [Mariprofundus sp.]|nr:hypothetical protein [Mariprofundus sp.]